MGLLCRDLGRGRPGSGRYHGRAARPALPALPGTTGLTALCECGSPSSGVLCFLPDEANVELGLPVVSLGPNAEALTLGPRALSGHPRTYGTVAPVTWPSTGRPGGRAGAHGRAAP